MKRIIAMLLCVPAVAVADDALVAVATNFYPVLERLRDDFEATSSHHIELSGGSTGVLYAQIRNGAPYDAFFAADQLRPAQLEKDGAGVANSRFTYAEGRLALWSSRAEFVRGSLQASLQNPALRVLAIANPELAPYGLAAMESLQSVRSQEGFDLQVVQGVNVGQAFSMVATGNADAGIVALSSVLFAPDGLQGEFLELPAGLHSPILQDAILLQRGAQNLAAIAFLAYVQSDTARDKIIAFGYR